jgi:hypothetical protein
VIFVLSAFVFAMYKFQKHHVLVTGATVNEISALGAAEAGVSCVLAEIAASPRWATHEIQSFDSEGRVVWGKALQYAQKVKVTAGLTLKASGTGTGTYEGSVGKDPYLAKFKVKVGYLPLNGAASATGGGQANLRHLYVEALGFRKDPTGKLDRATRVKIMVERLNFTEFLLYDGGWVTIGMGSKNDPDGVNIFADGRIYGHQWVRLGNISQNGTEQRFVNLSSLRSAGDILTQSNFKLHFQAKPNLDGTPSSQPGFVVPFDSSTDSDGPGQMPDSKGRILDGKHGGQLPPPKISLEDFKLDGAINLSQAKGAPIKAQWHSYTEFDSMEYYEVDFGRAMYGMGSGDDSLPEGIGQAYPANFNGIIWSEKSIMVWGAPDRDVTIVSGGDIFVSGDFNVRESHRQDYKPDFESEVNEEDQSARVQDAPYYSYVYPERFTERMNSPGNWNRVPPEQADRKSCALVALGNLWRDYRYPGRLMRNELLGLLAWEMLEHLRRFGSLTDVDAKLRQEAYVSAVPSGGLVKDASGRLVLRFQGVTTENTDPPIRDDIPELTGDLRELGYMFPWTPSDQDDPQEYLREFPNDPNSKVFDQSTIQQELDKPAGARISVPGYWLRWYVTKKTKIALHTMLQKEVGKVQGLITYDFLWGSGLNTGLLWKIYDLLLEDEKEYFNYKGLGLPRGGNGMYAPEMTSRLALANAPQRLYNLVRDEKGTDIFDKIEAVGGGKLNVDAGLRSDHAGKRPASEGMQKDRLYMPQQTINAMIFVKAKRNDKDVPGGDPTQGNLTNLQDATSVARRFFELGNPSGVAVKKGLHYLSTVLNRTSDPTNIITPIIQRIRGSYIRFANGAALPPQTTGGYYYPPIRRRIYDPDLVAHPPPFIPAEAKVRSWHNVGATAKDYREF